MSRLGRRRARHQHSCFRCGNEDDLAPVRDHVYCEDCRECRHGHVYIDRWDPGCVRCVRDLHTLLSPEGPCIDNMKWYVIDCLRWGIDFTEIEGHTFLEYEALVTWTGSRHEPFTKWYQDRPPHWQKR